MSIHSGYLITRLVSCETHIKNKQREINDYTDSLRKFQIHEEVPQRNQKVDEMNARLRCYESDFQKIEAGVYQYIKQNPVGVPPQIHEELERLNNSLEIIETKVREINIPTTEAGK